MMTESEFTTALAQQNKLETERAETHQAVLASIAAARKQNEVTKAGQQKLAAIDEALKPLAVAIQGYVNEQNAIKKKAADEAKAKEQSELEATKVELEKVKAELAAKG